MRESSGAGPAHELVALLSGPAGQEATGAWNGSPAEAVLSPLLAAADEALERELARTGAAVLPSARRDLMGMLSRRLVVTSVRVLALERQALDATARMLGQPAPPLTAHPAEWRDRFERHPVLARLLERAVQGWRTQVRELLQRCEADRPLLTSSLWESRPPGALAGVHGDVGDVHEGGRSVAVLRFEDGRRAVYKPKDLRITGAVLELCAFLNASLPMPLHVRAVLPREGYTWEEFVPAAPCHSSAEVERFYFRMGMLTRLMQLLESADLWFDNLVAAGEHPVFIDLEMVLQPRRPSRLASSAERAAEAWLRESVALLGVLSAPTPVSPGIPSENLGALAPAGSFLTSYRSEPLLESLSGGARPSREGFLLWSRQDHAPTLEGAPVRVEDHLASLLEGYRAMNAALRREREGLLDARGPLARMAGLPVRYTHRTTWSYYRLLEAGLAPSLLVDPARREKRLADLLHAREVHPEPEAERAVARVELESLLGLDVPHLLCLTDSDSLLDVRGRVIGEGFFQGNAYERARQRVRALEDFPLARHEALLWSTLAGGHHAPRPGCPSGTPAPAAPPDWLAEAVAVGDAVLEEAFREGDDWRWVGLGYEPLHAFRCPTVLPPDLLSGTAGLGLVLAELHVASGHARFREAALGSLKATREAVTDTRFSRWETGPQEVGAFRGAGAHLFTLHHCAGLLGAPELKEMARDFAASLPLELIAARASLDLVTGAPGLLLALIACGFTPAARTLAAALTPRLRASLPLPMPGPLRLLPDVASGWALCAARLREVDASGPWAPLPLVSSPESMGNWLARLVLGQDSGFQAPPPPGLEEMPSDASSRLEELELALVAAASTGDSGWRAHAEMLGRSLLAGRRARGGWFPERLAADAHEPSALWGLGAVAHAFLRLHRPGRWPCLWLLGMEPRSVEDWSGAGRP